MLGRQLLPRPPRASPQSRSHFWRAKEDLRGQPAEPLTLLEGKGGPEGPPESTGVGTHSD